MTFARHAKRAARFNPTWKTAKLYAVAEDDGATIYADGEMQYDLIETTFGHRDLKQETEFTFATSYEGSAAVTVISEVAPNRVMLIEIDNVFYVVSGVASADAAQATIKYAANSIDEAPLIRNA